MPTRVLVQQCAEGSGTTWINPVYSTCKTKNQVGKYLHGGVLQAITDRYIGLLLDSYRHAANGS